MYRVHLTKVSRNEKTGPIPVSTTDSSTCPKTCAQYETCYAKFGPLMQHWRQVDDGRRSMDWVTFCGCIRNLPHKQLWRHNQAGDLPGDGTTVDAGALSELVAANTGKRGFTFSHYGLSIHNQCAMEAATDKGFTINYSCDTLTQADRVRKITRLPLTVVLHSDEKRKSFVTEGGNKVVVCPATYRDDMQCFNCGICYDKSPHRAIVGFPAHGTKKKVINLRLEK